MIQPVPYPLFIRTDATKRTGIGHLMRSIALAQEWRDRGGDAVIIGSIEKQVLTRLVEQEGFTYIPFGDAPATKGCVERFLNTLGAANNAPSEAWIVLDGYQFDDAYQEKIKSAGYRLLVIDDIAHVPYYHADIIVNQNIHADRLDYRCDEETVLLLGTPFVMLRKSFLSYSRRTTRSRKRCRRVLITFGGVDSKNITTMVIQALNRMNLDQMVADIVVGPEFQHRQELNEELRNSPYPYEIHNDVTDISFLLANADLAITAGGSTCWELAYMGVPNLVIIVSDNQKDLVEYLDAINAVRSLGWWHELNDEKLNILLTEIFNNFDKNSTIGDGDRNIVDGMGAKRICSTMNVLTRGPTDAQIKLRKTDYQDLTPLFRLANLPTTRKHAFSSDPIHFREHTQWFNTKLNDPENTFLCVFEHEGVVLAQARYDRINDNTAEIDIAVHPAFRGRGLGSRLLKESHLLACDHLNTRCLKGLVLESNDASRRCFMKSEFKAKRLTTINSQSYWEYEMKLGEDRYSGRD